MQVETGTVQVKHHRGIVRRLTEPPCMQSRRSSGGWAVELDPAVLQFERLLLGGLFVTLAGLEDPLALLRFEAYATEQRRQGCGRAARTPVEPSGPPARHALIDLVHGEFTLASGRGPVHPVNEWIAHAAP